MVGTFWGKKNLKTLLDKVFRFIQPTLISNSGQILADCSKIAYPLHPGYLDRDSQDVEWKYWARLEKGEGLLIIVIDNYDSFTYNLVQYLGELASEFPIAVPIEVYRNDKIDLATIEQRRPDGINPVTGVATRDSLGCD